MHSHVNPLFTRSPAGRMLDWSLPGGQDQYFRAMAELAPGDELAGEKMAAINKKFNTHFAGAH